MIRNFIWGSTDFKYVRRKVSWKTIAILTSEGGLGLVDPLMQCKTLLENFVVRGLLLRNEPWKLILQLRMKEVFPKTGDEWTRSPRWWSLKDNLQQVWPTSMDEWLHQPLVWNPLFLDDEGSMLGRRVRLNWAQVDSSFASSLSNWQQFVHNPTHIIQQEYRGIRGGKVIVDELRKLQLPL